MNRTLVAAPLLLLAASCVAPAESTAARGTSEDHASAFAINPRPILQLYGAELQLTASIVTTTKDGVEVEKLLSFKVTNTGSNDVGPSQLVVTCATAASNVTCKLGGYEGTQTFGLPAIAAGATFDFTYPLHGIGLATEEAPYATPGRKAIAAPSTTFTVTIQNPAGADPNIGTFSTVQPAIYATDLGSALPLGGDALSPYGFVIGPSVDSISGLDAMTFTAGLDNGWSPITGPATLVRAGDPITVEAWGLLGVGDGVTPFGFTAPAGESSSIFLDGKFLAQVPIGEMAITVVPYTLNAPASDAKLHTVQAVFEGDGVLPPFASSVQFYVKPATQTVNATVTVNDNLVNGQPTNNSVVLSATIKDVHGNPVAGIPITFDALAASDIDDLIGPTVTTNAAGFVQVVLQRIDLPFVQAFATESKANDFIRANYGATDRAYYVNTITPGYATAMAW